MIRSILIWSNRNRAAGASATSNPIIIADLIKTGRFDESLSRFMREGLDDGDIAWHLTDMLVRQAQQVFALLSGKIPREMTATSASSLTRSWKIRTGTCLKRNVPGTILPWAKNGVLDIPIA